MGSADCAQNAQMPHRRPSDRQPVRQAKEAGRNSVYGTRDSCFPNKGADAYERCTGPLNCLRTGQKGTVLQIDLSGALEQRLTDLGLVEGTQVACRMTAPPGDPLAFELRGAVIALRASDAKHILCRLEGGG